MEALTKTEVDNALRHIFDKASGVGYKVDVDNPDWAWRDIIGDVNVKEVGVGNPPSLNVYNGVLRAYQFSVNDEVFNIFHMPHDYAKGTDVYIHAHWSHNNASVTSGGVTWGFDVSWAKGFDQAAFSSVVSTSIQQDASTTQYQHMVAEVQLSAASPSASQIDSDILEVDGLFLVRTYLSGNTINGTPDPFLHTVDLHYQTTNLGTKGKAPDFYA